MRVRKVGNFLFSSPQVNSQAKEIYPSVSPLGKSKNETYRKLDTHIERAFSTEVLEDSDSDITPGPSPDLEVFETSQLRKTREMPKDLKVELQEEIRISTQLRAHSTFAPEMHDHMAMEEFNVSVINENDEENKREKAEKVNQEPDIGSDFDDTASMSSDMATINIDKSQIDKSWGEKERSQ